MRSLIKVMNSRNSWMWWSISITMRGWRKVSRMTLKITFNTDGQIIILYLVRAMRVCNLCQNFQKEDTLICISIWATFMNHLWMYLVEHCLFKFHSRDNKIKKQLLLRKNHLLQKSILKMKKLKDGISTILINSLTHLTLFTVKFTLNLS